MIERAWTLWLDRKLKRPPTVTRGHGIGNRDPENVEAVEVVPASQLRGAVKGEQEWKAEAYRLRTIIEEATKQDAGTCKRWLLDALAVGGQSAGDGR